MLLPEELKFFFFAVNSFQCPAGKSYSSERLARYLLDFHCRPACCLVKKKESVYRGETLESFFVIKAEVLCVDWRVRRMVAIYGFWSVARIRNNVWLRLNNESNCGRLLNANFTRLSNSHMCCSNECIRAYACVEVCYLNDPRSN